MKKFTPFFCINTHCIRILGVLPYLNISVSPTKEIKTSVHLQVFYSNLIVKFVRKHLKVFKSFFQLICPGFYLILFFYLFIYLFYITNYSLITFTSWWRRGFSYSMLLICIG